ncbi:helix-turn-helix transcriptional regulator [Bacillus benzoevorans]|uniref:Putative transcriptional regulator n=1 Tax=Bacillus benzoevorans TaxID=1456 RepID=A0A7X0HV32_9BACI|nr:helix-turn-helix transcriptional regulator [Bacillus benzoevorans]MBB6446106.1 putative transcriptional regulator [Bacillus benzoevorans]
MKLYNRVREFRIGHGLSQKDLAQAIDVNLRTISQIESGRHINPSLNLALKMARLFNVPVEELFRLDDYAGKVDKY